MNFPATPSDVFNFPSNFKGDVQIFHANNLSTENFQQWIKPRGTSMSFFFLIGGGGGGGGGHQKPSTTNGGGGGGGGSGGIAKLLIPSFFLPASLYIQVGVGGLGGAASTAGGAGTISHVSYSARNTIVTLISSQGTNAGGGGAGTLTLAGAGGTGAGAVGLSPQNQNGIISSIVGQNGGAGGAVSGGANGTSITAWSLLPISSGAGGASPSVGAFPADLQGGSITSVANFNFPKMNFTTVDAVAAGGGVFNPVLNGSSGINFIDGPFLQSGGAGGGSSGLSTAGNGGNGGIGCGGGGGGAGTTGGRGGNGGNGMVAIFSW